MSEGHSTTHWRVLLPEKTIFSIFFREIVTRHKNQFLVVVLRENRYVKVLFPVLMKKTLSGHFWGRRVLGTKFCNWFKSIYEETLIFYGWKKSQKSRKFTDFPWFLTSFSTTKEKLHLTLHIFFDCRNFKCILQTTSDAIFMKNDRKFNFVHKIRWEWACEAEVP